MLSDHRIRQSILTGQLSISGFSTDHLQPASVDVHLAPTLLVLRDNDWVEDPIDPDPIDPKVDTTDQWVPVQIPQDGYVLRWGEFALGSTLQRIGVGQKLVAQLEGKSSLGRLGLMVHSTAGFIDPGFQGQVTLELSCVHPRGIVLYPGMPIGQVAFDDCFGVEELYHGKYQQQHGPTVSRYFQNWTGTEWK